MSNHPSFAPSRGPYSARSFQISDCFGFRLRIMLELWTCSCTGGVAVGVIRSVAIFVRINTGERIPD
jgi:hypothetical protein